MNSTCRFFYFLLITLLLSAVTATDTHARFRALLIGINYHGADSNIRRLGGAVNDAKDLYDLMTQSLGISPDDILILTEQQATRKAILSAFQHWLIEGTRPGDTVFFQFSGHGAQVPDPFGTQQTDPLKKKDPKYQQFAEAIAGYDTTLNPSDKSIGNLIFDTELNHLLRQIQDREITLFLDFCHSAGVTRNFTGTQPVTRFLTLPWDPRETNVIVPPGAVSYATRGIIRRKADWQPPYTVLAAVQYYQEAHEYPVFRGHNGAFTYPVLKLLRANPGAQFTNQDVFSYAVSFIRNVEGIAPSDQSPVFLGPPDAANRPFALLAVSGDTAPPEIPPSPRSEKMGVRVMGRALPLKADIEAALRQSDYADVSQVRPYLIVEVTAGGVDIFHAAGRQVATVPAGTRALSGVMQILEGQYIVRELASLENPTAPFMVDLWIDEPEKFRFSTRDRVTLYYRINRLPGNRPAYLTLVNVAPDGTISILYPQKSDFYTGPGDKRFLNAPVIPGQVQSIPKTRIAAGSSAVSVDARIRLAEGREYFKAIITSEPVDWQGMGLGAFRSTYSGGAAKGFVVEMADRITRSPFWATGDLRVEVTR